MAIKPNDCVIKIADLVVGTKKAIDLWNGKDIEVTEYEKYWENFNDHVNKLTKAVDITGWKNWKVTPRDMVYTQELKKFGAVHKETKDYNDSYIKFKSHAHLTMFVLRFS